MGRPKGKISDTENIGLRMPNDLIKAMDLYAEDRKMTRSGIINQAVEDMVNSTECILCGERNNGNGHICSVCESKLFSEEHIKTAIGLGMANLLLSNERWEDMPPEILEIREYMNGNNSYFDKFMKLGLKPEAEYIIDRRSGETRYLAHFHFVADGVDLVPKDDTAMAISKEAVYRMCEIYAKVKEEGQDKKSE